MAMTAPNIDDVIRRALQEHIRSIADEEAQKAAERVSKRVHESVAQIVLSVMKYYQVENLRDRVIITVKETPQ